MSKRLFRQRRDVALLIALLSLATGCSGSASEDDQLERTIRELAENGASGRIETDQRVESVECEVLDSPVYDCLVTYGEGALFPFCAELRGSVVLLSSGKLGCGEPGDPYRRATPEDFS